MKLDFGSDAPNAYWEAAGGGCAPLVTVTPNQEPILANIMWLCGCPWSRVF